VTIQMQEALEKAQKFEALSEYSYKLVECANKAMVLNEKSKVLLEECMKELNYLDELINGRPEEALQDAPSVQNGNAKSHNRKNSKAKKDVS
jgi:hypothetical protein